MSNEKENGSRNIPVDMDIKSSLVTSGDVVNAVDVANYRLGSFSVSYFGKDHNRVVVLARSRSLLESLDLLSAMLEKIIVDYEAI